MFWPIKITARRVNITDNRKHIVIQTLKPKNYIKSFLAMNNVNKFESAVGIVRVSVSDQFFEKKKKKQAVLVPV